MATRNPILIFGRAFDGHIQPVRWGLERLGKSVEVIDWALFPIQQSAGISVSFGEAPRIVAGNYDSKLHGAPSALWYRKLRRPNADPSLCPDDISFSQQQASILIHSIELQLARMATGAVANHPSAIRRADNKPEQLIAAASIGLPIVQTCVTNSVSFALSELEDVEVVHKTLTSAKWTNRKSGRMAVQSTVAVCLSDEPIKDGLRYSPSILQERIFDAQELRVHVIGREVICAAIKYNRTTDVVDWRYQVNLSNVTVTPYDLPSHIAAKCICLSDQLGLQFGCIDMFATRDGEYIFLEINQAGQFLWVEELCPELHLLDKFCRYLADIPSDASPVLTLRSYDDEFPEKPIVPLKQTESPYSYFE